MKMQSASITGFKIFRTLWWGFRSKVSELFWHPRDCFYRSSTVGQTIKGMTSMGLLARKTILPNRPFLILNGSLLPLFLKYRFHILCSIRATSWLSHQPTSLIVRRIPFPQPQSIPSLTPILKMILALLVIQSSGGSPLVALHISAAALKLSDLITTC